MIVKLFLFLAYRTILLKTHFAYVVSISILFATTKLQSRHEEIFHVLSVSSDEVDFSISFILWLRSFSCSLPRTILLKTHFAYVVSISSLFATTKLLSRHEEIFHVFSLSSDEVDFSIGFIRWLRSFSCSLPRTILLKTHFAYVVSISILFATTKLLSRHEEIFHVFSLSSDEVEFSISFVWWLWSFSCSF